MEELDVKEILKMFNEKKFLIIIITIVCILVGGIYSFFIIVPEYKSSTTIVLTKTSYDGALDTSESRESITQTDLTLNQKLVSTYSNIVKSSTILSRVIANLEKIDLTEEELRKKVTVTAVEDTEVIEISVVDENPQQAAKIANEILSVFEAQIQEMYKIDNVYTLDAAKVANYPCNINHTKTLILSAMIGIILSCSYIIMVSILNNTTKNKEEIEQAVDLPVLGILAKYESNKKKTNKRDQEIIFKTNPRSPLVESIKALRTNLQFMKTGKELQTILVTSTLPSEGKSWVSLNLAVAFAQTGKKTVIIDADMRKETLKYVFDFNMTSGLSNYLSGVNMEEKQSVYSILQKTEIENLYAITAGDIPPNPSELLLSEKMQTLFKELEEIVDIVIIDGTPSILVSDSVILSRLVNSTIIVSQYNKTKISDLKQVKENVEKVGGKIAGVVLNQVPIKGSVYEYGYGYGYYGTAKLNNKKKVGKYGYYDHRGVEHAKRNSPYKTKRRKGSKTKKNGDYFRKY